MNPIGRTLQGALKPRSVKPRREAAPRGNPSFNVSFHWKNSVVRFTGTICLEMQFAQGVTTPDRLDAMTATVFTATGLLEDMIRIVFSQPEATRNPREA